MTIKTAGELRGFLADVLIGIKNGTIAPEEAAAIAKVSSEINKSLAVEVAAAVQLKGVGGVTAGSMPIASSVSLPDTRAIEDGGGTFCEQCDKRVSQEHIDACGSRFCKAKNV